MSLRPTSAPLSAARSLPPLLAIGLLLVAAMLVAVSDVAKTPKPPVPPGAVEQSVPGRGAPLPAAQPDPDRPAPALVAPSYPVAASETVTVPAAGRPPARLGNLPVTVMAPAGSRPGPEKVTVQNLDHPTATKLGSGTAMALVLRRADGQTGPAPVRLTVDYSAFAQAAGANYADRLRLVTLPGSCAAQPDATDCSDGTPVPADNNPMSRNLSATVAASGDAVVYAVTSTSSGATGDYRATDLNVAQKWSAGGSGGSFTYSYPIDLPPTPYGDAPGLTLNYDSGTVDGRTSKHNGQASWIGQGWNINVPYIERSYKACSDDGHPSWGDLCWHSPYSGDPAGAAYVISIDGHTSELLKAADGSYHMRDDQSYRIEHHTGGPNGDNDGEYWMVSTLDGTQYYLGYGQDLRRSTATPTNSNWTVPVISDDSGEPCHQSDLASCQQTYRWNADEVHGPNETYTVYYYETETNTYRRSSSGNDLSYVRGGYLSKIEYGKVYTLDAPPPAYVSFTHYNRCTQRTTVPEPDVTPPPTCPTIAGSPSSYPDVPTDLICSSGCSKHSPSFFVTDWLDSVNTFVQNAAGGYDPVSKYQLKHSFPATGDGSDPALWLDYIRQIGYQGGVVREAVTSFDGANFNNRVDYNTSLGVRPLSMRRLVGIHNSYGGETQVTYGHQNACFTGGTGASGWSAWYTKKNGHWDTNTDECFPELFKPEGAAAGWGIFHKYVVLSVRDIDHVGAQPDRLTTYMYLDGAGWHHDDDMLLADDEQSYGDWRGYDAVQVTEGSGANTERTVTTTSYFRGMFGDVKVDGTTRTTRLTDYDKNPFDDGHYLEGKELQEREYRWNADGTYTELASQRWEYWDSGITANGPGLHNAHMIRTARHLTRDLLDSGAWRIHETDDTYDSFGVVATETDQGDAAVSTDTTCTTTSYARNTTEWRWMIAYPESVELHQDSCTGPTISRTVTLYDGAASTDDTVNMPFDGNPTEIRSYVSETVFNKVDKTFDDEGRVLSDTDPRGNTTTTAYTPATGHPTGGVAVTNPLHQTTTTWTSPAFGQVTKMSDANSRVAETDYDALGRVTAVWLPTEARSGGTPSYSYSYVTPAAGIAAPTGPTLVTTRQLQSGTGAGAVWLVSYQYQDGFAEPVEVQAPSPQAGGRQVTVTRYDSRGLTALVSAPFYNSGAAASGLLNPAEAAIPQYTTTSYDSLEQKAVEATKAAGAELWRTTTTDHGDHTVVVPPTGGQVVTWTDVFDKPTKTQNYLDATKHQDTAYSYTPNHQKVASITDPNGNVTRYGYDWLDHRLVSDDPDSGRTTNTYDPAGNVVSVTNAKGQKRSIGYDALGRVVSTWAGDVTTGTKLTGRTYDSVAGGIGQPASTTGYVNGAAYTVAVTGYDARYRVTGRSWTIPAPTGLANTYQFGYGYDGANHQTSITYPAAGGLAKETVTESYTALGLPDTLTGTTGYVAATTFSGAGKLAARRYGSTVERQYTYETTTNRLSTIHTLVNGATVQTDGYAHDPVGNVVSIADRVAGQIQCFGYDGRQRLTSAYTETADTTSCAHPADSGGPAPYNLAYAYDGSGNITAATSNGATAAYTYPAQGANAVRPHAVSTVGANSYSYDPDGNLSSRTVGGTSFTFGWDPQNQLTSVTTAGKTMTYVYDADGNRLLRTEPGATTLFLDSTELTLAGGTVTATRYYTAVGATVAQRTPAGLTWLTADQQGSEQLAVSATGTVSRQRYTPYGASRGASDQLPTDRGFLGDVQDDATGLVQLGARFYDPTIGKFLTPDPLDNNADPTQANPYSYAAGNPTTSSDPSGLMVPCNGGAGGCGTTGYPGGSKHRPRGGGPSGDGPRRSGGGASHHPYRAKNLGDLLHHVAAARDKYLGTCESIARPTVCKSLPFTTTMVDAFCHAHPKICALPAPSYVAADVNDAGLSFGLTTTRNGDVYLSPGRSTFSWAPGATIHAGWILGKASLSKLLTGDLDALLRSSPAQVGTFPKSWGQTVHLTYDHTSVGVTHSGSLLHWPPVRSGSVAVEVGASSGDNGVSFGSSYGIPIGNVGITW